MQQRDVNVNQVTGNSTLRIAAATTVIARAQMQHEEDTAPAQDTHPMKRCERITPSQLSGAELSLSKESLIK
jgi:hypothetical protein